MMIGLCTPQMKASEQMVNMAEVPFAHESRIGDTHFGPKNPSEVIENRREISFQFFVTGILLQSGIGFETAIPIRNNPVRS